MHCISPTFDQMAILPPFNNLWAQVVKRGNPPRLITSGVRLQYSIKRNTTVVGKTDFWNNAKALFGVDLPVGIGLTGKGLAGTLDPVGDHFEARGIPTVPYDDSLKFYPYQKGVVTAVDANGHVLCAYHRDDSDLRRIALRKVPFSRRPGRSRNRHRPRRKQHPHPPRHLGGNLTDVDETGACASCHSDNALGTAGNADTPSLSLAMHGRHARLGSGQPGCYDCHPGSKTQCLRTAIEGMGPTRKQPNCERCHGDLTNVAQSIAAADNLG